MIHNWHYIFPKKWFLTKKGENILTLTCDRKCVNFSVRSNAQNNCKQRFWLHFIQDFTSKLHNRQRLTTVYILTTAETIEQHGNFNLFHFQYNQM